MYVCTECIYRWINAYGCCTVEEAHCWNLNNTHSKSTSARQGEYDFIKRAKHTHKIVDSSESVLLFLYFFLLQNGYDINAMHCITYMGAIDPVTIAPLISLIVSLDWWVNWNHLSILLMHFWHFSLINMDYLLTIRCRYSESNKGNEWSHMLVPNAEIFFLFLNSSFRGISTP